MRKCFHKQAQTLSTKRTLRGGCSHERKSTRGLCNVQAMYCLQIASVPVLRFRKAQKQVESKAPMATLILSSSSLHS